jgi:hypothetical protein
MELLATGLFYPVRVTDWRVSERENVSFQPASTKTDFLDTRLAEDLDGPATFVAYPSV